MNVSSLNIIYRSVVIDEVPHVVQQLVPGHPVPGQHRVEAVVAVIEQTDKVLVVLLPGGRQLPGPVPHLGPGQVKPHQQRRGVTQREAASVCQELSQSESYTECE